MSNELETQIKELKAENYDLETRAANNSEALVAICRLVGLDASESVQLTDLINKVKDLVDNQVEIIEE